MRIDTDLQAGFGALHVERISAAVRVHRSHGEPVNPVGRGLEIKKMLIRRHAVVRMPALSLIGGVIKLNLFEPPFAGIGLKGNAKESLLGITEIADYRLATSEPRTKN